MQGTSIQLAPQYLSEPLPEAVDPRYFSTVFLYVLCNADNVPHIRCQTALYAGLYHLTTHIELLPKTMHEWNNLPAKTTEAKTIDTLS